ncbi:TonB-dependent receptor [Rhodoblastus acidophilus]|uniref:TonB-dependent receptor n=1 Tax=Candidatus Rhodoblastus alkanivorans TaxID=2954117 RepID=A0ABS9ZAF2_9HYPH|nr:TonB-dependent receptor [Candidatus Rhodoblastus alkanivorans]MCI4684670.1 TonB-dependent receptor [Candidatus Rhodoblastus alkanivorans]MDI4641992.1 TonB-dependent receptor [Rhodoblastus acidophilus]
MTRTPPDDYRAGLLSSISLIAFLASGAAFAQTAVPDVNVNAPQQAAPASQTGSAAAAPATTPVGARRDQGATVYDVDQPGVDLATGGGGTNSLRSVANLPGVDAPAIDPFSLANIPGGTKGIRIRGALSQHGDSLSTVDGIPLSGIDPGVGNTWLINNENLSGVTLYQGPVPSNVNSYFTASGIVNSNILWPKDKMGAELSQSFGSYGFLRSFGRIDSGYILNNTTKFFISGSWTDANKWRGYGQSPNNMDNFAAGVESRPTENLDVKAFVGHTGFDANTYAGLTYAQARDLSQYRTYDFSPFLQNPAASLVKWYGYNTQSFNVWTTFAEINYHINGDTTLTLKPYYLSENGYYLDGMATGMVRKWIIDHDYYGGVAELKTRYADTNFTVGYWGGVGNIPGPPSAWQMFAPNTAGGLTFKTWGILADQTTPNIYQAAYGMADRRFGALHAQAGFRYLWTTIPGLNEMNTAAVGLVDYNTALALSSGPIYSRSVNSFTVGTALPFLSLAYDVTKDFQLRASAGVNSDAPAYDLWPVYQGNAAKFLAKGLTANALWSQIRPQTTDAVDLGFGWKFATPFGAASFEPTFFYARNYNQNVSYDPGIGVQYSQNVGESRTLGGQGLVRLTPRDDLSLFAAVSYQSMVFVSNLPYLPGASTATIASTMVNGKQIPDVPLWVTTLGGEWRWNSHLSVTPILNLVSQVYGDVAHTQPIPGYGTVDLKVTWRQKLPVGEVEASLIATNLFNQAYIGLISAGYYQASSASGIYYPGAPRAVIAKLDWKY